MTGGIKGIGRLGTRTLEKFSNFRQSVYFYEFLTESNATSIRNKIISLNPKKIVVKIEKYLQDFVVLM